MSTSNLHGSLAEIGTLPHGFALIASPATDAFNQLEQPQATFLTGLMAILAATIAFMGAYINRNAVIKNGELQHGREVKAARQNRYTQIAEQLASGQVPVRLAGVYALSALADEWQDASQDEQRNVCVNLLCAYLREPPLDGKDAEVRTAVCSVIRNHTTGTPHHRWPGSILNLSGADLSAAKLYEANLSGANLRGANLFEVDMYKVDLSGANLQDANLRNANLEKANLHEANLRKANLERADLKEADVSDVNLRWACLRGARLAEANLTGADTHGADQTEADLSGAKR